MVQEKFKNNENVNFECNIFTIPCVSLYTSSLYIPSDWLFYTYFASDDEISRQNNATSKNFNRPGATVGRILNFARNSTFFEHLKIAKIKGDPTENNNTIL